eukprot:m.132633 g.132633  ORF g.132633 m.132633 type:complete len:265 (-) comp16490_c0_seq1:2111-2905(-)
MAKLPVPPSLILAVGIALVVHFFYNTPRPNNWPVNSHAQVVFHLPHQEETVYFRNVLCYVLLCMAAVCLIEIRINKVNAQQVLAVLMLCMLELVAWTYTTTVSAKTFVSAPRPDFWARCVGASTDAVKFRPDGSPECPGDAAEVEEGMKSFPSGHASVSVCIGAFCTMYLMWTVYFRPGKFHWRTDSTWTHPQLCQLLLSACMIPLLIAFTIALTRIVDHWHSPADVLAGVVLGLVNAGLLFPRLVAEYSAIRNPSSDRQVFSP